MFRLPGFLLLFAQALAASAQGSGYALHALTPDHVDCGPGMNDLDFPYTMEAWVNLDVLSSEPRAIWDSGVDPGGDYYGSWIVIGASGQIVIAYGDGTGPMATDRRSIVSVPSIPLGRWVHVCGVQDGPLSGRIYLNGVEVPTNLTGTGGLSIVHFPTGRQTIGYHASIIGGAWTNGRIDEVRIWDVARTEAEIRETMCQRLDGTEPGLAAYWPMDEGVGTTIADVSGNGHDGTFVGAPTWELSGAAIGDTSVWAYPPAFPGPALSLPAPSGGAQVRIDNQAAPAGEGFHLYRVDEAPNSAVGLPPATDPVYWGVFASDPTGTWDAHVDLPPVTGFCLTCSLDWVDRNDNAAGPWSPVTGAVGSGCSFALPGESATGEPWRTEYAWADTTAPVPAAIGPTAIVAVCPGDSVPFGGTWVSAVGLYTDTLTAAAGCDSLVFLDLVPTPPILGDTLITAVCAGDSVLFGGVWYGAPGLYPDTLPTAAGCDSIAALLLFTPAPVPGPTTAASVCAGDSVLFGGAWYSTPGLYADTLLTGAGCDSLVFLDLALVPPAFGPTLAVSVCAGDSVLFGGAWLSAEGLYTDTLAAAGGCDSLVFLDLDLLPPAVGPTLAVSVCAGDSVLFGGAWLSAPGLYTDTLATVEGCDSLVFLDLTVRDPGPGPTAAATICAGDSLPFAGAWLSAPGLYADTLATAEGCDSLVFLDLTVEDCPEPDTCLVLLPNAFSPNGDGLNDGFGVPPQLCPELDRFRLEIYNRWGQRIFLALDRDRFWDGTWQGTPQELGVYVWVLRYRRTETEAEQASTGTVTLVR